MTKRQRTYLTTDGVSVVGSSSASKSYKIVWSLVRYIAHLLSEIVY